MQEEWEPDWLLPEQYRVLKRGDGLNKAIDDTIKTILAKPSDADAYHLLFHLFNKAGDYDGSWCVAGLVAAFGKATRTEGEWYREHLLSDMIDPERGLTDDDWLRYIVADRQDLVLSQIFGTSYLVAGDVMFHHPLQYYGIDTVKHRIDLSRATPMTSALRMGAKILGMGSEPPVFGVEHGRGLRCLPTQPMVIGVGPDTLEDRSPVELRFMAGKALSYFYLWHPMAALYEPMQLGFMLMAIARVAAPELANFAALDSLAKDLETGLKRLSNTLDKRLSDDQRKLLRECFEAYRDSGRALDVGDWDAQVELTSNHAGLYVTDDIEAVGSFLLQEYSNLSPADTKTKIEDFVRYVVGGRYRSLRKEMGVDIEL